MLLGDWNVFDVSLAHSEMLSKNDAILTRDNVRLNFGITNKLSVNNNKTHEY